MPRMNEEAKKSPARAMVVPQDKLLVCHEEAAEILSISVRSVDYLLANRQRTSWRIGTRNLIPMADLRRFARMDPPERLAD